MNRIHQAGRDRDVVRPQFFQMEVCLVPVNTDICDRAAGSDKVLQSSRSGDADCFHDRGHADAIGEQQRFFDSIFTGRPSIVSVAPKRRATSRRLSSTSIMMICDGEKNCAVSNVASPMGPAPIIATVEPRCILPFSTPHSKPVGRISLKRTRASSSVSAGMGKRLVSAWGIRTNSAWVPSIWPSIQPPLLQCEYIPRRQ